MINIYTDASVCPDNNIATYAFFIDSDDKIIKSGVCKNKTRDTTEAEIYAIINSIYYYDSLNIGENITIHTDSSLAYNALIKGIYTNKASEHACQFLNSYMKDLKYSIKINKVNGHSDCNGNNICDEAARSRLRIERYLMV